MPSVTGPLAGLVGQYSRSYGYLLKSAPPLWLGVDCIPTPLRVRKGVPSAQQSVGIPWPTRLHYFTGLEKSSLTIFTPLLSMPRPTTYSQVQLDNSPSEQPTVQRNNSKSTIFVGFSPFFFGENGSEVHSRRCVILCVMRNDRHPFLS